MMHQRMDLSRGFQIEEPHVFVPWDTPETHFMDGFEGLHLRLITHGYFTTHCTSLESLSHELGFHFRPRKNGRLVELEFFSTSYSNLAESYQEFQRHLEKTFGAPTTSLPGSEGYPSHNWRFLGAEVIHSVYEHFGPAEYVRIKRIGEHRE